jgi:hypothetical protein
MVNYAKGKIYKIVCNITNVTYIGSTTKDYLCDRLAHHKNTYKRFQEGKAAGVCASSEIIKNGDYNIILIESYPCETKDQLISRERHYIDTIKCINKYKPGRTKKEWSKVKNLCPHCGNLLSNKYLPTHKKLQHPVEL